MTSGSRSRPRSRAPSRSRRSLYTAPRSTLSPAAEGPSLEGEGAEHPRSLRPVLLHPDPHPSSCWWPLAVVGTARTQAPVSDASRGSAVRAPGCSAGSSGGTRHPQSWGPAAMPYSLSQYMPPRVVAAGHVAHGVPEKRPRELDGFNAMAAPVNEASWLYRPGRGPSPLLGQLPGQRPLALLAHSAVWPAAARGSFLRCLWMERPFLGTGSPHDPHPDRPAVTTDAIAGSGKAAESGENISCTWRPRANRPPPRSEAMGETRERLKSPSLIFSNGGGPEIHSPI